MTIKAQIDSEQSVSPRVLQRMTVGTYAEAMVCLGAFVKKHPDADIEIATAPGDCWRVTAQRRRRRWYYARHGGER